MIKALTMTFALLLLSTQAEARHRQSQTQVTTCEDNSGHYTSCFGLASASGTEGFLPHPSGCPRIAFCGCGAMRKLGLDDRRLYKASSWYVLYHGLTQVAVWPHHVAVIDHMTGPRTAMAWDYNSGGHLSRYHEIDLHGARIVGGA